MSHIIDEEKNIVHNNEQYAQKHLTQEEMAKVNKMIKKNPSVTAISAITGIVDSRIFKAEEDVENINPILLNKDRIKHEIRKSRIRGGLSNPLSKDSFEEFAKIEEELLDCIFSAEITSSKFCIMFSAPE